MYPSYSGNSFSDQITIMILYYYVVCNNPPLDDKPRCMLCDTPNELSKENPELF